MEFQQSRITETSLFPAPLPTLDLILMNGLDFCHNARLRDRLRNEAIPKNGGGLYAWDQHTAAVCLRPERLKIGGLRCAGNCPGSHPETRQRGGDQIHKGGHRVAVWQTLHWRALGNSKAEIGPGPVLEH